MSLSPENIPKTQSGRFILVATVDVKPGKLERVLELVKPVRDRAVSDEEPLTHTYRTTVRDNTVIIFEEYSGVEGFKAHVSGPPFVALGKAAEAEGLWNSLDAKMLEEF